MEQPLIQESPKSIPPSVQKWCEVLYNIIWAIVFWLALNKTVYNECPNPIWFWSQYAKYYFTVAAVTTFLCYTAFPPLLSKLSGRAVGNVATFLVLLLLTIVRVSAIPVGVGMVISYLQRDECPSMETIVVIQFFLTMIGVGVVVLSLFCAGVILSISLFVPDEHQPEQESNLRITTVNVLRIMLPILRFSRNSNRIYF